MIQGFAGNVFFGLTVGGAVVTVTRYNPDGTTTDVTAATTQPALNMVQIDCSGAPLSSVGIYLYTVVGATALFLGSGFFDVVAAGSTLTAADVWTYVTRVLTAGTNITIPTAIQNADALLDRADAIETGLTPRQAMRLTDAALAGKLAISGNTVTVRNTADTKDRIVATTTTSGQRTAVTYDVS